MIDLHVLRGARPAAVDDPLIADPIEDPVELRFADLEGIVVPLEAVPIVEIDRQGLVDPHRSKMRDRALILEAKDPGKKPGGFFLVASRDNRMVEKDGHSRLRWSAREKMMPIGPLGNIPR